MTVYDAAWPKGAASRRGDTPRLREAAPGSQRDALYAARYTVVDEHGQPVADVEFTDGTGDVDLTPTEQALVDQAVADETPPEARSRRRREPPTD